MMTHCKKHQHLEQKLSSIHTVVRTIESALAQFRIRTASLHILVTLDGRILEPLDDILGLIQSFGQLDSLRDGILLTNLIDGCTFIMRSFDIDNFVITTLDIV
jgi:hypothetical protein